MGSNDPTNRKLQELKTLTTLIRGGIINAQRGLDDDTHRERDVLGTVVEMLFQSTLIDTADPEKLSPVRCLSGSASRKDLWSCYSHYLWMV